jgi:hypothetical protein
MSNLEEMGIRNKENKWVSERENDNDFNSMGEGDEEEYSDKRKLENTIRTSFWKG